jgi:glycogen synthase
MRIAFITTEFSTEDSFAGGLAQYLLRICLSLKERCHTPEVFVLSAENDTIDFKGISVHRVKKHTLQIVRIIDGLTWTRFRDPLSIVAGARSLAQRFAVEHRQRPFDIVQCASYRSTNLFVKTSIPRVVRISSFEPLWRKAYEFRLTLSQRVVEWLEAFSMRKADVVFGPSEMLATHIGRSLRKEVSVIRSPFVMEVGKTDDRLYNESLKGKKYLLFFGTVGLMKGCKTIADILEPLLTKHSDVNFVFIGKVGKYDGMPMMDHIREKSRTVSERVFHFDAMRHEKLYPFIKNALGVLLPSRIDNFPNTCLEAMHFGRVVAGTRGAGFEEIITDGVSGFLCPPDDAAALQQVAEKIVALSVADRRRIGEMAKDVVDSLGPEFTIPPLIDVYRAAIQNMRKEALP